MTTFLRRMTFAALMLPLGAGAARADAVVTACASDIQAGAGVNLAQALAAGGVIRFACPPGTSIRVTGRYTLAGSARIDGGDSVTLDGHGTAGPLLRATQNTILLRITLRGFAQPRRRPVQPGAVGLGRLTGSVLATSGDAELDRVTIEGSDGPIDIRGRATVKDSAFVGNPGGYALVVGGAAFIERTRFTGNGSALLMGSGSVRRCDFTGQTAGAVRVGAASGPTEIRHSTFATTRGGPALALSQRAGRAGPQTVTLRGNIFRDNGSGAINLFDLAQEARERGQSAAVVNALASLPPSAFVFGYNRFESNGSARGGAIAANLAHTGGMISTGDLFIGNAAGGAGGAVAVSGGMLRLSHALFKGNRAGGRGAALAVAPDARATLSNALIVSNAGPAGAIAGGGVTLVNVTIADNAAAGLLLEDPSARVANAILAHNAPADCVRVPAGVFQSSNLASDATCPEVAAGEAFLDAFYVPVAGSPALHAGDPAICKGAPVDGFDLAFQGRLDPAACALGAFEQRPVRKLSRRTDRHEAHATEQDDFSDEEGYRPPPGAQVSGPDGGLGSIEPSTPTDSSPLPASSSTPGDLP